jgi:hypothetical protein
MDAADEILKVRYPDTPINDLNESSFKFHGSFR